MTRFRNSIHAIVYAALSLCLLYILHLLPVNQLFIDPFSEAIKHHDVMDITFSKFRDHNKSGLFDNRIIIINSGVTDRAKLAQTIDLVNAKGAAVIGLDLLLDTLYENRTDTLLRDAMQNASDKLVLGYSLDEKAHLLSANVNSHSLPFFRTGLQDGYVNLSTNDGFSVRAFVPFLYNKDEFKPAFSTQLANKLDTHLISTIKQRNNHSEWINFRRVQPGSRSMIYPINSKKAVHYVQMEMNKLIADSALYSNTYFKNKIVLIGFCGENENALSMSDRYFTPLNEQYTGRSLPDMFGIVIHANIISMLLDKDFLEEFPESVIYLFAFLISYINYFAFKTIIRKHHFMQRLYIRLFQIMEFVFIFSTAIIILAFLNWKLSFFFIATTIILSFELYHLYTHKLQDYFENWFRKWKLIP
jgi:CHASE2 domain-containing sensor protein